MQDGDLALALLVSAFCEHAMTVTRRQPSLIALFQVTMKPDKYIEIAGALACGFYLQAM